MRLVLAGSSATFVGIRAAGCPELGTDESVTDETQLLEVDIE